MAGISMGLIGALAAVAGSAMSMKNAHDQKKAAKQQAAMTPTFNADAQQKKIASQEAEANKKRIMSETDTVHTTALGLGNTGIGTTETKKKTLLGG